MKQIKRKKAPGRPRQQPKSKIHLPQVKRQIVRFPNESFIKQKKKKGHRTREKQCVTKQKKKSKGKNESEK